MEQTENRIDHHRARIIGTITAAHFLLSVALFLLMLASGNARFEGGGPSDLTQLLLDGAFQILSFPLWAAFLRLRIADPGIWAWLAFLANSVLWGWAAWRAIRFWRSRQRSAPGPAV